MAVQLSSDRPNLLKATEGVIQSLLGLGMPDSDSIVMDDMERCIKLAHGLTDRHPAPPEILDWLHYQAVHEAGHAVVACRLGIRFDIVRIVYDPGMEPCCTRGDPRLRHVAAGGAAAEELVFGRRREWGCVGDRRDHEKAVIYRRTEARSLRLEL